MLLCRLNPRKILIVRLRLTAAVLALCHVILTVVDQFIFKYYVKIKTCGWLFEIMALSPFTSVQHITSYQQSNIGLCVEKHFLGIRSFVSPFFFYSNRLKFMYTRFGYLR